MTIFIFPKGANPRCVPDMFTNVKFYAKNRIAVAEDKKISTQRLLKFYKCKLSDVRGWPTMRWYAELPKIVKNKNGQLSHPEFYLITKSLHDIPRKEWPTYNEIASSRFHQEIYGPAILCNANSVS